MDVKTPLIQAVLIGCVGVGLYATASMLNSMEEEEEGAEESPFNKKDSIKHVLSELK